MTTILQIIKEAYRESNILPIGQTPSANEQEEALALFNRFLSSVYGAEVGEKLTTIRIGSLNVVNPQEIEYPTGVVSGWYIPPSSRVVINSTTPMTLYLNPHPKDGERVSIVDGSGTFATAALTLKGNGQTIDNSVQTVLNTDGVIKNYVFRADTNNWQTVFPLALTDLLPFPPEFEDLFIIGVAIRLNPRNGVGLDPQTVETYKRLNRIFKSRYSLSKEASSEDGLVRLTRLGMNRAATFTV